MKNTKGEMTGTNWLVLLVIVIVAAGVVSYGSTGTRGWFPWSPEKAATPTTNEPTTPVVIVQPGTVVTPTTPTTANPVPVETLGASCKDKFTMAAVTTGNLSFYTPGADVSDPYITSIDKVGCGGTTTNMLVQTATAYDVYYNAEGATNYDAPVTIGINYNPETGKGVVISNGIAFQAVSPVGAFVDYSAASLPEVQSGLTINGQQTDSNVKTGLNGTAVLFGDTDADGTGTITCTSPLVYNVTTLVAAGNYSIGGAGNCYITLTSTQYNNTALTINYTKATDNLLLYDESALGGAAWFDVDIGNNNANSELQDVVMCFRDADGDMDGDEITSFTASYVSGTTAISIPGNLQTYWNDAMGGAGAQCFQIASSLGSSQKARWQFNMAVNEANFADTEEFEITFDDLGQYLAKQYPSRSAKATAVSLTIGDQA